MPRYVVHLKIEGYVPVEIEAPNGDVARERVFAQKPPKDKAGIIWEYEPNFPDFVKWIKEESD